MSEQPVHRDIFNAELCVGDLVIISAKGGFTSRLVVGKILKLNPKMIKVRPIHSRIAEHRYGYELLRVTDDPRTTAYILKNSDNPIKRR